MFLPLPTCSSLRLPYSSGQTLVTNFSISNSSLLLKNCSWLIVRPLCNKLIWSPLAMPFIISPVRRLSSLPFAHWSRFHPGRCTLSSLLTPNTASTMSQKERRLNKGSPLSIYILKSFFKREKVDKEPRFSHCPPFLSLPHLSSTILPPWQHASQIVLYDSNSLLHTVVTMKL